MHHSHIDKFAQGRSVIHDLDARTKLLGVLAYTAVLISFNRYAVWELAPMAILPVGMLLLGTVPMGFALRRVAILSPFIAMVCLASPLYDRSPAVLALGPWRLATTAGWLTAMDVFVKFLLGVLALTAMMCTTPFALLLEGMRRMRMPRVLILQLGFLYRYLFVLLDEAMRIRRGRDFRGGRRAPVVRRLAAVGGMVGSLFVRTLERSDRIHVAMCARGYRGEPHSLSHLHFHVADFVFLFGVAAYLAACRWAYPLLLKG